MLILWLIVIVDFMCLLMRRELSWTSIAEILL